MYQEVVCTAIGQQSDVVTGLQSLLRERDSELTGLCEVFEAILLPANPSYSSLSVLEQKIQSSQQDTAQQYGVQLAELCKQFEVSR